MQQRVNWEALGLPPARAERLDDLTRAAKKGGDLSALWTRATREALHPDDDFAAHRQAFATIYKEWDASLGPPPGWVPEAGASPATHLAWAIADRAVADFDALHRWSVSRRDEFWEWVISRLGIVFQKRGKVTLDDSNGAEKATWLKGSRLNIVDSCFRASSGETAILFQRPGERLSRVSYGELETLVNRVASGLERAGIKGGDAVAVDLPMTVEAVAAYLGILKAGAVSVSIADSFAPTEIATRLRIANAVAIITQDVLPRGGKDLPLYSKVIEASAPRAIVIPALGEKLSLKLRAGDIGWNDFLGSQENRPAVEKGPDDPVTILFSSGTTGDPKAIPWTQITPIKCAMDAHFHHDTRPGDVLAWPTSLGWMMGPWLIFASLVNRASLALYYEAPHGEGFGRFVEEAGVTMLGVVPSLVKAWRQSQCMKGRDWTRLRLFSSTGECSNSEDYLYLMSLAGYRPIVEYCGGTEIGGGYITGSLMHPASPGTFSCPALGIDIVILDERDRVTENGEMFLVPPSIGLSSRLLNRDHHEVYFEGAPRGPRGETLRRHGDQMERVGRHFRGHGRVDDTMNLGGIKVSSAEIERVVVRVPAIAEAAAIAINPPGGGPSELVLYVVCEASADLGALRRAAQDRIRTELNPLFKIHDLKAVAAMPRTASNKVMRRELRARYQAERPRSS